MRISMIFHPLAQNAALRFAQLRSSTKNLVSGQPRCKQALNKRCRLNSRNVEALAATHVFARGFVVQKNHITGGLGEFGAVAFVGAAWDLLDALAHQPAQIVRFGGPAIRAIQLDWLGGLRFLIKSTLVHICLDLPRPDASYSMRKDAAVLHYRSTIIAGRHHTVLRSGAE